MTRWYVVHALANKEFVAAHHLRNQGFEVLVPSLRRSVRHARRTQSRLVLLFPRYLFVAFDAATDRWRSILGTFGVAGLVMMGGRPQPLANAVAETIVTASDDDGVIDPRCALRAGDHVRILGGTALATVAGLVDLDDGARVTVLFELLGSDREATVSATDLAIA